MTTRNLLAIKSQVAPQNEFKVVDTDGNITINLGSDLVDTNVRSKLASTTDVVKGAALVGYKHPGTGAVARDLYGKAQEVVSVLDFIPKAEHAAIRAGTSTYDASTDINNALAAVDVVIVPADLTMFISADIVVPRYKKLVGFAQRGETSTPPASIIKSNNGSGIVLGSNNTVEGITLDGTSVVAGSVGIQIGSAASFQANVLLRNVNIMHFEKGIFVDNAYFIDFEHTKILNCTKGIDFNPTTGTGVGFQTTINLNRVEIFGCTEEGIIQSGTGRINQATWKDVAVEQCGSATKPQVKLIDNQAFTWTGGYIESAASPKPKAGIEAVTGRYSGMYINGAEIGFDGGSSSCSVEVAYSQFVGTTTSVSVTGAGLASIVLRQCSLDTTPTLSCDYADLIECGGAGLPTGIIDNTRAYYGNKPRLKVGKQGANLREIYSKSYAISTTVTAGTTSRISVNVWSSANAAAMAVPTTDLPAGLMFYMQKHASLNDRFQIVFVNLTGGDIVVNHTFILTAFQMAEFSA